MTNYNALSLNLLADAFTREEVLGANVFAVYGSKDTLQVLRQFVDVIRKEYHGTLFYVPLVEVGLSDAILGIAAKLRSGFVRPDDFRNALEFQLTLDAQPTTELWTRIVSIR